MPRKVFAPLETLSSSDVNTFLMDQSVMVFDNAAARNIAIPSPVQGMVTFLKDLNVLEAWSGSSWDIASGSGSIIVSETAPTGPLIQNGSLWFNSSLALTFVYYEDENSAQWVEVGASAAPSAAGPGGKILQVVSATKTDPFATSSGGDNFVDVPGVSVNITPTFSNSKMYILVTGVHAASNTIHAIRANIVKNTTPIAQSTASSTGEQTAAPFRNNDQGAGTLALSFLDTAGTTSQINYKLQICHSASTSGILTVYVGRNAVNAAFNSSTTITVMEVAP
jgi:hypothetical protein